MLKNQLEKIKNKLGTNLFNYDTCHHHLHVCSNAEKTKKTSKQ